MENNIYVALLEDIHNRQLAEEKFLIEYEGNTTWKSRNEFCLQYSSGDLGRYCYERKNSFYILVLFNLLAKLGYQYIPDFSENNPVSKKT